MLQESRSRWSGTTAATAVLPPDTGMLTVLISRVTSSTRHNVSTRYICNCQAHISPDNVLSLDSKIDLRASMLFHMHCKWDL